MLVSLEHSFPIIRWQEKMAGYTRWLSLNFRYSFKSPMSTWLECLKFRLVLASRHRSRHNRDYNCRRPHVWGIINSTWHHQKHLDSGCLRYFFGHLFLTIIFLLGPVDCAEPWEPVAQIPHPLIPPWVYFKLMMSRMETCLPLANKTQHGWQG